MKLTLSELKRIIAEAVDGTRPPPEGWDPDRKFHGLTAQSLLDLGNGFVMPLSWLKTTNPEAWEAINSYLTTSAPDYLQSYWADKKSWYAAAPSHPAAQYRVMVSNSGARISYMGDGIIENRDEKFKQDVEGNWENITPKPAKPARAKAKNGKLNLPKDGDVVQLTWLQVRKFFPGAAAAAQRDYAANVASSKEDGDWDPEEPGILAPSKCSWSLQVSPGNVSLSDHKGYELHMYDEEAIASFSGGGSDMVWTGDEWEM